MATHFSIIGFISTFVIFLVMGYLVIYFLTRILFFISEQTTLTRIYHQIGITDQEGERLPQKILKMCACNFNLSVPLILTFMFIIKNTNNSNFNSDSSFLISLALTIGTLYSMRVLSNPTKSSFKPRLIELLKDQQKIDEIKVYQERMVSFFFSFISATIIFILVAFLYSSYVNPSSTMLTDLSSIIMPLSTLHSSFEDFVVLFFCYTILLTIFTVIGEYKLKNHIPLLQMK
jgi:hypothetical protein